MEGWENSPSPHRRAYYRGFRKALSYTRILTPRKRRFRSRVYPLLRDRSISFRWFKTARPRLTRDYTINYRFDFISSIARRSRARSYPSRTARPKASEDFASSPR